MRSPVPASTFPRLPVCPTLYSNFAHINPGATAKVGFGSAEAPLGGPLSTVWNPPETLMGGCRWC